jgi:hypothetical protein
MEQETGMKFVTVVKTLKSVNPALEGADWGNPQK